jgi:AraC family ethanolamine operon transcriptional activator
MEALVPELKHDNFRSLLTADIDELAQFQINKNRRYTQLQPGVLTGSYAEVNLGDVQVFRENLTAGALIEATPIASFIPFAAVLSDTVEFDFCGKKHEKNSLLQATGGSWDASFKHNLNFVVAAFNRQEFNSNLQKLTGREMPSEWLISKSCATEPEALNRYAMGLDSIINRVQLQPEILHSTGAMRMLSANTLRLVLNTLMPTTAYFEKPKPRPLRIRGVRLVIDYLHSYVSQLPTIPQLCDIAQLSERNLQYGFREYLGITPIRYLRLVRLNRVKQELLIASPETVKIMDVALKWGFLELGRFAGEYRQLFQELPSETLCNRLKK